MKRFLGVVGLIAIIIVGISIFSQCGGTPSYSIYNLSYDPQTQTLDWDDDSEAEKWIVEVNGEEFKTKQSQLSYDAKNQDIHVSIEGLHGDEGDELNPTLTATIYYLPTVTGLTIQDGNLRWNSVPNATAYEVYNNGSFMGTYSERSVAVPAGSFSLEVKPIRDDYYYSYMSEPLSGLIMAAPTNLRYSDGEISWDAVADADYYELTVNGQVFRTETNSYAYDGNKQDIVISVTACSNQAGAYVSAPLKNTCRYLEPITEFGFDEAGSLIWDAVEGATRYEVVVNGTASDTVTTNAYSNIQLDTYYTVAITPRGDFTYTDEPTPYSFEKLSPVTNVLFKDGMITWDAHARAVAYEVVINGESYTTPTNSYNMGNVQETMVIEVYALGGQENSRSFMATSATYTYVPKVTNIRVEEGMLKWDASEGAASYTVKIVNQDRDVNVTETVMNDIVPNTQYVVQIYPNGVEANSYSYWSAEFSFSVLPAPTLRQEQGVIAWSRLADATGYRVRITRPDGTIQDTTVAKEKVTQNCEFVTAPGTYTVAVQYLADSANPQVYDSAFSAPFTVTQLENVSGHTVDYSSDNSDNFNFSVNAVNGASAYRVTVNGAVAAEINDYNFRLDIASLTVDNTVTTFRVEVVALGRATESEIVLDSRDKHIFNVIKLATPTNLSINGSNIGWSNVSSASKYIISIDGLTYESATASYTPGMDTIKAGTHTVKIRAYASAGSAPNAETEYMNSSWSTALSFTKLPTPANVRIEPFGTNTALTWDTVTGATGGYTVVVNNTKVDQTANVYNISGHLSNLQAGEAVEFYVYAKGNGGTVMDSDFSATKTVARFAAPTNLTISGDNLTWTASEINGVKATNYELYINGEKHPVTGTSYSVSNFTAGTYLVYVKALGDNSSTVDSPESGRISVVKLAGITNLQKVDGGKTYTWDTVSGASRYEVKINNDTFYTSTPSFDVGDHFVSAGTYSVSIRAISADPNTMAGDVLTFTQSVAALNAPRYVENGDVNNLEAGTFTLTQNGYDVTVYANAGVNSALSVTYKFYIDGVPTETASSQWTVNLGQNIPGWQHTIQAAFLVSGFSGGTYYVSSADSIEATVIEP